MTTITTKETRTINWSEIKAAAEGGTLIEGSEIRFSMKDGTPTSLTVADARNGAASLVFTDCVTRLAMYERLPKGRVSWSGSDVRKWANEEFIKNLPDELVSIIVPREIVQTVGGEELVTQDVLWAPSVTELFGRKEWAAGDDPAERQFPIFKTERSRVKMFDGETYWYWTRSPHTSVSTSFAMAGTDGSFCSNDASNSNGVCLGLYV